MANYPWHSRVVRFIYSRENSRITCIFRSVYHRIENGWEATPRIRGALLTFNGPAQTGIEFSEPFWNYEKNLRKILYVNGNNTLSKQNPSTKGSLTYDAGTAPVAQLDADPEESKFSFKFDRKASLIGPSRAVLYLSTSTKGDFDVYVQLRKADGSGRLLQNLNIPFEDLNVSSVDDVPLISPTKYLGPSRILRASNREIHEETSKPHWTTLSHKQVLPASSEDPVRVAIEIWPTGIQFKAGEQLVLKVSSHFMGPAEFVSLQGTFPVTNGGQHALWWGSGYESYVEVPCSRSLIVSPCPTFQGGFKGSLEASGPSYKTPKYV